MTALRPISLSHASTQRLIACASFVSLLLLSALCGQSALAQTAHFSGTVSTVGSGFSGPTGVAVDGSGNVFVADNGYSAVKEIVAVGGVVSTSSTINTVGSGFSGPAGVAVDGSGNVFVADQGNSAVKEIVAVGGVVSSSSTVNTVGSGFNQPSGVAVDGSGNVFVADYGNSAVKEIVAAGGYTTVNTVGSGFSNPYSVAVDGSGNVFVADYGNTAVKEIVAVGGVVSTSSTIKTVGSGFNNPFGVAVDGSGNVFVADQGNSAVKEIVAVGGVVSSSSTVNTVGSGFSYPYGVAVDGRGNVFVADTGNNAVKEIMLAAPNFGSVAVGVTTPPTLTFNFTFDASVTLGSNVVLTQGAKNLDFTDAGTGSCASGTAYTAGETCTVVVKFLPQRPGQRLGAVELTDNTGAMIASAHVVGTGTGPAVVFPSNTSTMALGSGFALPWGVAVDGSGNVFVADNGNHAVKEIVAVGGVVSGSSTVNTVGSGFNYPVGVAVDGSGNVFVADNGNHAVKEIVAVGGVVSSSSTVNTVGSGFSLPYGVAVDGSGNVFVADYGNSAVKEIVAVGGVVSSSSTVNTVGSGFSYPVGVAVDGSGNVFVADYNNNAVKEIVAVGGVVSSSSTVNTVGGGFSSPVGVAVDGAGNVFVADLNNNAVKEIVAVGGVVSSSSTVNTVGSGFSLPTGVAVYGSGNVFVADYNNNAVKEIPLATPPSLTFASTSVGSTSSDSPQTVTVQNIGNAALTFPAPSTGTNPSVAADFALSSSGSNLCPIVTSSDSAGTLASGAICDLPIEFSPTTVGTINGSVVLTDTNLNASPSTTQTIALSGTGTVGPAAQLVFSTPPQAAIPAGGSPGTVVLSVEDANGNVETGSSASVTLTVTGPNSYSQTYGPIAAVSGVATFSSLPALSASGFYGYAATDSTDSLNATPATETVVAGSYTAATTNVASTSAAQTATVLFTSNATLNSTLATAIQVFTQGAPNKDFVYASGGTCAAGASYTAGQACTVEYTFAPKYPGLRLGAIQLYDDSATPVLLATVPLSGTGTGPAVVFPSNTSTMALGSGFSIPFGVAVDGAGNVYVADNDNNAVKKIPYSGGSYGTPVKLPSGTGFYHPTGVTVDGAGNVYVADDYNNAVKEIPYSGGSYGTPATLGSGFKGPQGVAVDGAGNVYVADTYNNAVKEIPYSGGSYGTPVTLGSGFTNPSGVAVDGAGNVYVADYGSGSVYKIAYSGGSYGRPVKLGSGFNQPYGVAVDGADNVYVADTNNNAVKEIPYSGGSYGTPVSLGSGFSYPTGVAVDGAGNVYVADQINNAVKEIPLATPPSLIFASTNVGSTSSDSPQTVTVQNIGNAALTLTGFAATSTNFSLSGSTCTSSTSLPAGGTCAVSASFTPQSVGALAAAADLTDNSLNVAGTVQAINLSGTGTAVAPTVATVSAVLSIYGSTTGITVTATESGSAGVVTGGVVTFGTAGGVGGSFSPATCTLSSSGTCTTTYMPSGTLGAGSYPDITASFAANNNYSATSGGSTLIVGRAALTITAANAARTYGAANPAFTGTYTGAVNGDTFTISGSTTATASSPVGPYSIVPSATGTNLADYNVTPVNGTLTVGKAALTITAANAARTYGTANPAFTGSYTGAVNGDTFTISGSTTATASSPVGPYSIVPSAVGTNLANYTVTPVNGTLTVGKAALTVTAANAARTYGTANPSFTGTYTGAVNGDTFTISGSTTATASSPVGPYSIVPSATGTNLADYNVTPVNGTLTVGKAALTITAANAARTYGTANPAFTGSYTGAVNGDTFTISGSTTATASSPVGPYSIVPSAVGTNLANYTVTPVNGTLTVGKAALTVTAANAARTYGTANPSFTGTYTGAVNGDTFTISGSTTATASSPVGPYSIVPSATGTNLADYNVTPVNGTLTVGRAALTITAANAARTYGAANPAFTGTYTGAVNGDTFTVTGSTTATASSPVGPYSIVPSAVGTNLADYTVTPVDGTLTVGKAALTITAASAARTYGTANPSFTGTYTGAVNGDTFTISGSTTATASSPVGPYSIVPSATGTNLADYNVTPVNGTLTVGRAALTITAANAARTYGAANPAFTGTYTGAVNGDTFTVTGSTTATASSPVGPYSIVPSAVGTNLADYTVTPVDGTLTVGKAALTITAASAARTYGAANPAFTGTYTGAVNGDTFTISGSTTATASSPVGPYSIVPSAAGTNLANYTVTPVDGTLTVGNAALTVTAANASRTYGSANPAFTGTVTGQQNGDIFTERFTTAATASSPAGTYAIVPSVAGTTLGDYTVAAQNGTLTVAKASAAVAVASSANPILKQNALTFTASVSSAAGTPTGTVLFMDGTTTLGTGILAAGVARFTTSSLAVGAHTIMAVYSGDANFGAATSAALAQTIEDFNLNISTSAGSTVSQTVVPGGTATYTLVITPIGGAVFPAQVNFSLSGLPPGATATFTPPSIAAGSGTTTVTLTVTVPQQVGMLAPVNRPGGAPLGRGLAPIGLGILILPFAGRMRRSTKRFVRLYFFLLLLLASAGAMAGLSGCINSNGFSGQPQTTSNLTLTATSGTLSHTQALTLTVE